MKAHLLALLLLVGCSGPTAEKRAVTQPKKDPPHAVQSNSDKYRINVAVIPIDTTLISPAPSHPAALCAAIQDAWHNYLRQYPTAKRQLAFEEGIEEKFGSAFLRIDRDGRMRAPKHVAHSTQFTRVCMQALASTLYASQWRALYRKTRTGPHPLASDVTVYFSLLPDGSFSVAFTDFQHMSSHFFKCGNGFGS